MKITLRDGATMNMRVTGVPSSSPLSFEVPPRQYVAETTRRGSGAVNRKKRARALLLMRDVDGTTVTRVCQMAQEGKRCARCADAANILPRRAGVMLLCVQQRSAMRRQRW